MKTVYELKFEKLLISSISACDCTVEEKAKLFWEFYNNGTAYYEELCEALFLMSTGQTECILYITAAGKPYLSFSPKGINDKVVLYNKELPKFHDDLYDQLNYFFERFPSGKNIHNLDKTQVDFGSTLC